MQGSEFDEAEFFAALARSDVRALLIGRRALVLLGLPVLTADYDFWVHVEDAAAFNAVAAPFGLWPSRSPEEARSRGRYVLENDERVDVLLARFVTAPNGDRVVFDDLWERRTAVSLRAGVVVQVPALDDLIATKRVGGRPKDAEDIRLLEVLRAQGSRP